MTNEEMLLQTLGTNEDAKTTLANILTEYFPSVVSELSLPARIVEKFYDWQFPFIYTTDGAGTRKWSVSVRALCERNPKLADLDAFFNASGTDGTFQETYGGNDTETNTDNSARRTKTEFNGVDDPTSQSTSESIVVEPVDGKNTTERKTEYGKTRTYADGRTWSQILADVMDTRGPVYLFINSFAQIMREPAEDPCDMPVYPPSMQMKVNVNTIPAGDPATASVTNQGTLYNAIFDVLFNIPQGERGIEALMSTYTLTKESDPNVNDQVTITAENFPTYFSRDPAIDDRCIFVAKNTSTGESFILGVTCTTKLENYAVFTVVSVVSTSQDLSNYAQIDGSYAGLTSGQAEMLTDPFTIGRDAPTATSGYIKFATVSLPEAYRVGVARFEILDKNYVNTQTLPCGIELAIKNLGAQSCTINANLLYGSSYYLSKIYACVKTGSYPITADLYYDMTSDNLQNTFACVKPLFTYFRASNTSFTFITDNEIVSTLPTDTTNTLLSDIYTPVTEAFSATNDGDGNQISTTYAKLASPAFTGTPTAPTPATPDNSTKIATTAFVHAVASGGGGSTLYLNQVMITIDDSGSNKYVIFNVYTTKNCDAAAGTNIAHLFDMFSADNALMVGFGIYSSDNKMYPCIINVSTDESYEPADQRINCMIIAPDNLFSIEGLNTPNCTCEIKHFRV